MINHESTETGHHYAVVVHQEIFYMLSYINHDAKLVNFRFTCKRKSTTSKLKNAIMIRWEITANDIAGLSIIIPKFAIAGKMCQTIRLPDSNQFTFSRASYFYECFIRENLIPSCRQ